MHRILSLAILLGASRAGLGQTAPSPDDSLKGKLWTATAERIWVDTKPKQPQPAPWPTVQAFEKWLVATPADKSELGLLHADVVRSFDAGTKASPAEVARAIIGQLTQRQQSQQGRLARVKVPLLGADLAPLTQARPAAATPGAATSSQRAAAGGTTTVTALPGAGGVTALPANPDSITNGLRPPAPVFTTAPVEPRYFGLPPNLAGLVLLLAGGLLGVGLTKALGPSRRRRPRRPAPDASAELDSTAIMSSQEYRKLQKQNQNLNTQLHRLRQELAELKQQLGGTPAAPAQTATPTKAPKAALPAPTAAAPVAAPAPAPAELPSIEELVGAPAEAPAAVPAATRYGPVQETPFLEERKIVDHPLPQLALMLTVNPRDPNQATFTLNPQVDQARLIGDGLTRLQKFFDYDPPLGGRITAVAAVQPGRLQRHDSGWQVVERARLAIS